MFFFFFFSSPIMHSIAEISLFYGQNQEALKFGCKWVLKPLISTKKSILVFECIFKYIF